MELQEIFEEILNGNAVLFCGAGFSHQAYNEEKIEIGSTEKLIKILLEKLDIKNPQDGEKDIGYLAEQVLEKWGEAELIEMLKKHYRAKEWSEAHTKIANLPWFRIYTTNYDDILEQASKMRKSSIITSDSPYKGIDFKNSIVHLNGSVEKLTNSVLNSELKLTETSYIMDNFLESPWSIIFESDLRQAKLIVIIGYSFKYDLDIKRIFSKIEDINEKVVFVNGNTENKKADRYYISKLGKSLELTKEEFVEKITEFEKKYVKKLSTKERLYCFKKYKYDFKIKKAKHNDIFSLIFSGNFEEEYIGDENYFIHRERTSEIIKNIKENKKKIFFIKSSFGNGKTIILNELKRELSKDFLIYEIFQEDENKIDSDINNIIETKGRKVIIVDDGNKYFNFFKKLNYKNLDDIVIIITSRIQLLDMWIYELTKYSYFDNNTLEYNIEKLSSKEKKALVGYFELHNLWGKLSNKDQKQKYDIISKECQSQFNNFLLKIVKNSEVGNKLKRLTLSVLQDKKMGKIFFISLIISSLAIKVSYAESMYLLNYSEILPWLRGNPNFKEIVDLENSKLVIRSSIIAKYILDEFSFRIKNELIDLMIEIMKKMDNIKNSSNIKDFKYNLVSFSNFQFLIKNFSSDDLIRYYEGIKNYEYCLKNPYFWIQYANAEMHRKNYKSAEVYIGNAESFSQNRDLYQIDSCKARFYMEEILYNQEIDRISSKELIETFLKAHNLLINNRNTKAKWYFPIKQAKLYEEFWNKYQNELEQVAKNKFLLSCYEMRDMIEKYTNDIEIKKKKGNHYVNQSRQSILSLIKKMEQ